MWIRTVSSLSYSSNLILRVPILSMIQSMAESHLGGSPIPGSQHSLSSSKVSSEDGPDLTSGNSTISVGNALKDSKCPHNTPQECSTSSNSTDASSLDDIDQKSEHPPTWGDYKLNIIRKLLPDEPLHPGDVDVTTAYAGPAKLIPMSPPGSDLSSAGSDWDTPEAKPADTMQALNQDGVSEAASVALESGNLPHRHKNLGDGLFQRDAKDIAALGLAAGPRKDNQTLQPATTVSTPLRISKRQLENDDLSPSSSAYSTKVPRSPIWRSLVPVSPPAAGYWIPKAMKQGEKNTPMCPPCRTGKKGRCYGGLPCDRCREKGYSKERCEGSLVFRFAPRTKHGAIERYQTTQKPPLDAARWKRDASGRFL